MFDPIGRCHIASLAHCLGRHAQKGKCATLQFDCLGKNQTDERLDLGLRQVVCLSGAARPTSSPPNLDPANSDASEAWRLQRRPVSVWFNL
jgi:hypothetical protein